MTEVHFSLLKPHGHEREKQDAVWLKQQQKTSQSCHKPPDELTAHSVNKYANKCQKKYRTSDPNRHRQIWFQHILLFWMFVAADVSNQLAEPGHPAVLNALRMRATSVSQASSFLHLRCDTSLRALHHWRQSQSLSEWSGFYTPPSVLSLLPHYCSIKWIETRKTQFRSKESGLYKSCSINSVGKICSRLHKDLTMIGAYNR